MIDRKCGICGALAYAGAYTSTICVNCYEVQKRIDEYVRSDTGFDTVVYALKKTDRYKRETAEIVKDAKIKQAASDQTRREMTNRMIAREYDAYMKVLDTRTKERDDYKARKDAAYTERNRLVALLTKLFPSWLERHPKDDENWDAEWTTIVMVLLPGQVQCSWHLHDSHVPMFEHLSWKSGNSWDGHTTEEKYARIAAVEKKWTEITALAATAGDYRNGDVLSENALRQIAEMSVGTPIRNEIDGPIIGQIFAATVEDKQLVTKAYVQCENKLAIPSAMEWMLEKFRVPQYGKPPVNMTEFEVKKPDDESPGIGDS